MLMRCERGASLALNTAESAEVSAEVSSMTSITALRSPAELKAWRVKHRHKRVGFVPTMGALHQGHLSLVRLAQAHADVTLASVFVNPAQFNRAEDLEAYPVDVEGDIAQLSAVGCDAVFIPSAHDIYPQGAQTQVSVGSLAEHLCGATRPGHFEGVCTVVSLLFNLTQCDVAVFGEKDYQQLAIIRQMVRDLHFPVEVIGAPTARASDGLALSSRNLRLSDEDRALAPALYRGLLKAQAGWSDGVRDPAELKALTLNELPASFRVDYLELCHPARLSPLSAGHQAREALLAVAVFLGEVRLIDNLTLR